VGATEREKPSDAARIGQWGFSMSMAVVKGWRTLSSQMSARRMPGGSSGDGAGMVAMEGAASRVIIGLLSWEMS
jgi:hypothetical protein